jgi:hypothetical protein
MGENDEGESSSRGQGDGASDDEEESCLQGQGDGAPDDKTEGLGDAWVLLGRKRMSQQHSRGPRQTCVCIHTVALSIL